MHTYTLCAGVLSPIAESRDRESRPRAEMFTVAYTDNFLGYWILEDEIHCGGPLGVWTV
jgi:hypothetical protein